VYRGDELSGNWGRTRMCEKLGGQKEREKEQRIRCDPFPARRIPTTEFHLSKLLHVLVEICRNSLL